MTHAEHEEVEPKIIKTQDENGEIHNFELIDVLNIDDTDYGLLIYLDADEESDEEEVIIMRLNKQDDAYTFETIDDEDEFNKVVSFIESDENFELVDEDDEDDEDDDDDDDEEEEDTKKKK